MILLNSQFGMLAVVINYTNCCSQCGPYVQLHYRLCALHVIQVRDIDILLVASELLQ